MKQVITIILSLSMLCSLTVFVAENQRTDTINLSSYVNNEVFIMYADGSFEVVSYDSAGLLAQGLEQLTASENVILIQPNYSYITTGTITDDELSDKQWVLSNDGSFYMADHKNEFPELSQDLQRLKQKPEHLLSMRGIATAMKPYIPLQ